MSYNPEELFALDDRIKATGYGIDINPNELKMSLDHFRQYLMRERPDPPPNDDAERVYCVYVDPPPGQADYSNLPKEWKGLRLKLEKYVPVVLH
jgi:hypothetical protein